MGKYLAKVSYNLDGIRVLRRDKASGRRAAITRLVESVGGRIESFYFAFGHEDVYAIMDLPDNVSAAAISIDINSAGYVEHTLTPLLTVEEVDRAIDQAAKLASPTQATKA